MMIKPKLICVGNLKEAAFKKINNQVKKHWEIIEIEHAKERDIEQVKSKEANKILNQIKNSDDVIVLNIKGESVEIEQIKQRIYSNASNNKQTVFIIGGSWGLDNSVLKRANLLWSFSNLTFPHQLIRIVLLQEIG